MKKYLLNSKSFLVTFVILNLFFAGTAFAKTTTWISTSGGAWTTAANWDNGLPATGDDIIILNNQTAAITAVPSITLNSLTISGNCNFIAATSGNTLTINGTFSVNAGVSFITGTNGSNRINFTLGSSCIGSILGTMTFNASGSTPTFINNGDLTLGSSAYIDNGSNASNFSLTATGILRIGAAAGISTTLGTGNIRLSGSRSYSAGSKIYYNGTGSQVTGNGLPTTSDLIINNASGVSLTATLNSTGTLTLSSGTLDMANVNLSVSALSGSGDITNTSGAAGARTLTVNGSTSPAAYSGAISNGTATSLSLIKNGTGTLTLTGNSSYTGTTTISGGTLSINSIADAGSNSCIGSGTTISMTSSSVVLLYTGTGHSSNRTINLTTDGPTINASGSGSLNLTGGITGATFNVTLTGTGVADESGVIATTSGTVTKNGTGTWMLSGANTYTGSTTISAGILKLGVSSSVATSGPLGTTASGTSVTAGAVLDLNGFSLTGTASEPLTLNGTGISNSGALTNSSATPASYIGSVTKGSACSIVVNTGDIALTNTSSMSGSFLLILEGTATGSISNIISGSGGITKNGSGTWTLSGLNTYTGATTVNGGILKAGVAAQAFGNGSNVTLANTAGVALDITGFNNTIGSLAGGGLAGSNVILGAATLTTGNSTNTSYAGIISGTGSVIKAGTGTWTLSGFNTYSGKTSISAGTINISSIDNVGAAGSVLGAPTTVANGTIDISGSGILLYTGTGHFSDRVINLTGDGATIDASGSGGLTLSGGITGATFNLVLTGTGSALESGVIATTNGNLTKSGTGTWTISGANTYTGSTTISSGKLKLGVSSTVATSGPLGTTGNGTTVAAGAVLDMDGFSLSGAATEAVTLNGTGISNGGALTNGSAGNCSYAGLITKGSACSINTDAGNMDLTNPGTMNGNFLLTIGGSGNGSIASIIGGSNGITKIGTGTWTLSGSSTYTGSTTVSGGTLKAAVLTRAFGNGSNITLANAVGVVLDLNNFSNTIGSLAGGGFTGGTVLMGTATLTTGNTSSTTYDGIIDGLGGVIKTGTGTWTLTGLNTYLGKTTISAGTLSINSIDNLNGNNSSLGNPTSVPEGTIDISATGTLLYTGNGHSSNRIINLTGDGATINASGSGLLNLTGGITGTSFDLILTGAGTGLESGIIGTGAANLTKNGTGTWTLSGTNTFTTGAILNTGTLEINNANALGTVAGTFTINGGTIDNTSGTNLITANYPVAMNANFIYSGSAPRDLNLGTGAVTMSASRIITVNAGIFAIGGIINHSTFNLTKAGAGTFSFGANPVTLSGLTIGAGTLVSTSGTLNLAGNYSNNGAFIHNNGTVNFNGASAQTINGSSVSTFNNLIINNAAGATLGNNENVDAVLTLTNGILTVPTDKILTISNGNAIAGSGFGSAKHILTQVNTGTGAKGFLRVNNMAPSASYSFPVGNSGNYLPVTLTPSDATVANNTFNICVFPGITANGEPNGTPFDVAQKSRCVDAVWTVNYNGPGTPAAAATDMIVGWPASLEGVNFSGYDDASLGIAHWDNPDWGIPAGTGDNTANTATRTGILTFSPFGVGNINMGALPIRITYFNAAKGNGLNTINWKANCSSPQVTFELLRSADGIHFTTINNINASQARCAEPFNYADYTAPSGVVYYRLKIIDADGKVSYSAIVKLSGEVKDIELTGIAPNPVMNIAQLKINTNKNDQVDLTVISMDGRVVYRNSIPLQPGSSVVNVDVTNLSAGMYMIKGTFSNGQTNSVKFIKK